LDKRGQQLSGLGAGWGGIEPPNGGITINLIIQRFQGAFEKAKNTLWQFQ
jgi:hypothetical protein